MEPPTELTSQPTSRRRPAGAIAAVVVGAVVLILLFVALGTRGGAPEPGEVVAPFSLERLDENAWRPDLTRIDLDDLLGQPLVINFWASWCEPCRREAPDLEASWREYQEHGVVFLGIAYKDAATKAERHLSEFDVSYPNVLDPAGRTARDYGVTGVPETFVVDGSGELIRHYIGEVTSAQLAEVIDPLLEQ
jgi:cytochrome c biogenesis protein CcmG/thiol:disulfide interchange protein DsbE